MKAPEPSGQHVLGRVARAACVPFLALSALGLASSVTVHVAAWLGLHVPERAMILHFGIFAVWLPTVLVSRPLVEGYDRKQFWDAALRGAPAWAGKVLKALFAYAIVNFGVGLFLAPPRGGAASEPGTMRLFSGHWMVFYAAACLTLYSALHARDLRRRCPAGHLAGPSARFCEACGAEVGATAKPEPSPGRRSDRGG